MTETLTSTTTRSADGTEIGFRSLGMGPDVVIVHGAMQSALSQHDLAGLLAPDFRVHLMDRRGRGESGPYPADPTTELEVADLRAVLAATGARRVLGISSGAIISAHAALDAAPDGPAPDGPTIERLALFEPPVSLNDSMRLARGARVDEAVARGDLGTAMGVAMKVAEMGPAWMFGLPVPILAAVSRRMLASDPRAEAMARALPADWAVIREAADQLARFAGIRASTLVINGTATRPYLRAAAAAVAAAVPGAQRAVLDGTSHGVTQNAKDWGKPELVAPVLREFFA